MAAEPTRSDWASLIALSMIWGGTFMVVAIALRGYGPVTVAAGRTTLGAVALGLAVVVLRRPWPALALWPILVPVGVLSSALPFFLFSWGQTGVTSAFAGLTLAILPLLILPLAHVFADEPLTRNKTLGVGLGVLGAAVLFGGAAFEPGASVWHQLACLGATVCYSGSSILTRRCPPVDPLSFAAVTLAVGAAILLPAALLFEGVPVWVPGAPGWAILGLGLVPTALAAFLRVRTIRRAGSAFMAMNNFLLPMWAMGFGALILNEALPLRFFLALVLILAGLGVARMRPRSVL